MYQMIVANSAEMNYIFSGVEKIKLGLSLLLFQSDY